MFDLSDILHRKAGNAQEGAFQAQIETVRVDGTVDLSVRGSQMFGVKCLSTYQPTTGSVVTVLRIGTGSYVVLGDYRKSNPDNVPVIASLAIPWTVRSVNRGIDLADNPTGMANPFIVSATASASYRLKGGWDHKQVMQGAYHTSLGFFTGCWFYGTKPEALKPKTVTGLRIRMKREAGNTGGTSEYLWVYPHIHKSRPGSSPHLIIPNSGPAKVGPIAVGETKTFGLPAEWAHFLTRGAFRGFAVRRNYRADYCVLTSQEDYALSGRLEMDWTD